ncbi:MAG: CPXCG motif-containing cysteine-rich protein [Acidiferrobacterales bacterium]
MTYQKRVRCPYCGESFETSVDCSAGGQEYIEDCQICCRPIVFRSEVDADGDLINLLVMREDD